MVGPPGLEPIGVGWGDLLGQLNVSALVSRMHVGEECDAEVTGKRGGRKMKNQKMMIYVGLLAAVFMASANAWTDKIETLKDVNSICKLEPESQCTSAVRIGLQAPGVDMHNASMASMRLDGANLQGANLSHAILQLANLKGANLMLANMEGAHLHAVNLRGANLMLADLRNVSLLDADLSGANLRGANLTGALLLKARFDNATWTDGRICGVNSIGECL